jgi:hypothetical protein
LNVKGKILPEKEISTTYSLFSIILPACIGGLLLLISYFIFAFVFFLPISEDSAWAFKYAIHSSVDYAVPFFVLSLLVAFIATYNISKLMLVAISITLGLAIFMLYTPIQDNSFFQLWGLMLGFILGLFYVVWYQAVIEKNTDESLDSDTEN